MGPIPTTNVRLVVVPEIDDLARLAGCHPSVIGESYSNDHSLIVNIVSDGYAILYRADVFRSIKMDALGRNIINILLNKFPNTIVSLSIYYNFRHVANPDMWMFDDDTASNVIQLANFFYANMSSNFKYFNSESIQDTREILIRHTNDDTEDDEDPTGEDDDGIDYDQLAAMGFTIPGLTDDDDDDDNGGSKRKRKHYGRSRLVSNGKSPKKDYNRHGVIVSRDSDDLDRDRKMIKSFLKDFIPGNARWKRDFRDDLLDRWMKAFVIRKKKLRKLEKNMKRKKKSKKPSAAQAIALGIGRQIMAGSDPWSNPNK